MKNIGVIINSKKVLPEALFCAMSEVASSYGAVFLLTEGDSLRLGAGSNAAVQTVSPDELYKSADFLTVFGGDGTILNMAQKAAQSNISVFGVNLGNIGYLTDADIKDAAGALKKILDGDYQTQKRLTLAARVIKADSSVLTPDALALNEFCVIKNKAAHMVAFDVTLNGAYINTYRADGIIISTPTGSTAYNLSAKGPILKPDGDMIALTPICPHDLFALCTVVNGTDSIGVKIVTDNAAVLTYDGKDLCPLANGDTAEIFASEYYLNTIKTNDYSFFDRLRKVTLWIKT